MEKNLWGNLTSLMESMRSPKEILEEQENILQAHFGDLIRGKISRISLEKSWREFFYDINIDDDFSYSFKILSDYVENYEYEICKLTYGIKMYPLAISFGTGVAEELLDKYEVQDGDTIVIDEEEKLYSALNDILSSKEVHQVLRGLLVMAKKEKEELPFI